MKIYYTFFHNSIQVHQLEVPIWKEPDYLCDALERFESHLRTNTFRGSHFRNTNESHSPPPPFFSSPSSCEI